MEQDEHSGGKALMKESSKKGWFGIIGMEQGPVFWLYYSKHSSAQVFNGVNWIQTHTGDLKIKKLLNVRLLWDRANLGLFMQKHPLAKQESCKSPCLWGGKSCNTEWDAEHLPRRDWRIQRRMTEVAGRIEEFGGVHTSTQKYMCMWEWEKAERTNFTLLTNVCRMSGKFVLHLYVLKTITGKLV